MTGLLYGIYVQDSFNCYFLLILKQLLLNTQKKIAKALGTSGLLFMLIFLKSERQSWSILRDRHSVIN